MEIGAAPNFLVRSFVTRLDSRDYTKFWRDSRNRGKQLMLLSANNVRSAQQLMKDNDGFKGK